jgi:PilZ domain
MTRPETKLNYNEARKAIRFLVGAPVAFSWTDAGRIFKSEGVTRDLSAESLFIWSQDAPPLGIPVQCHVFLPGANIVSEGIDMSIEGRVSRIEQHQARHHLLGFVIINERISVEIKEAVA